MITNGGQSIPFGTPGSGSYPQDSIASSGYATGTYAYGPQPANGSFSEPSPTPPTPMSYGVWAAIIIGVLIAYKFFSEHRMADMEVADAKVGVHNLIVVTLLASIGIVSLKTLGNKYNFPTPLKDFVNAI